MQYVLVLSDFDFNISTSGSTLPQCANAVDWFTRGGGGFAFRVATAAALNIDLATVAIALVSDAEGDSASTPIDTDLVIVDAAFSEPVPQCSTGSGHPTAQLRGRRLSSNSLTTLNSSVTLSVTADSAPALAVTISQLNTSAFGLFFACK